MPERAPSSADEDAGLPELMAKVAKQVGSRERPKYGSTPRRAAVLFGVVTIMWLAVFAWLSAISGDEVVEGWWS